MIALLIYLSPVLLLWRAFVLTDVSARMNSNQNITEIINDPEKKGAEIYNDNESLTLSWETLSDPMTNVRNASSEDIERLAKSVYTKSNYDNCVVTRENLESKVEFSKNGKLIYTIIFTGN